MRIGTKSLLFGVHQFVIHPIIVAWAWLIIYREWPKLHEWAAIITHDLGYFGCANMDGAEGEAHPEKMAQWWLSFGAFVGFAPFAARVAVEIIGHSRYHAAKNNLPLSKLFRPDKLAITLYPLWLYLLLGNLSGEIKEYMARCRAGKYADVVKSTKTQTQWLLETQAHVALMGLHGDNYAPMAEKMERDSK